MSGNSFFDRRWRIFRKIYSQPKRSELSGGESRLLRLRIVMSKNPEPLIQQRVPGFLFASWPTFDPLFSGLIIFITERPALYYYVCKASQQYGIIGSEMGQISDPFCFLNSRLFWNWIACLTRMPLSNTILSTCKLTTCRLIK